MAFISQDPTEHHQMVFVSGLPASEHQFVMADHIAFRTDTLDDLRAVGARLDEAGIEGVIPINHGNAWSLYFNDPEGWPKQGRGSGCQTPCPWSASPETARW
jgi:hypothetical protein